MQNEVKMKVTIDRLTTKLVKSVVKIVQTAVKEATKANSKHLLADNKQKNTSKNQKVAKKSQKIAEKQQKNIKFIEKALKKATSRSVTAAKKPYKKRCCPVPGCKGTPAPVFGMVCAKHKDITKAQRKKYFDLRHKKLAKSGK